MNKTVKVLSTAALAATLVVPATAPAFAASTVKTAASPVSVTSGSTFSTSLVVEVAENSFNSSTTNDSFTLRLPAESTGKIDSIEVYNNDILQGTDTNNDKVPDVITIDGGAVGVKPTSDAREFKINLDATGFNYAKKTKIVVNLKDVKVPSGSNGAIDAEIEAAPGSVFTSGKVTIATVGNGTVAPSVDDVVAITTSTTELKTLRFKEDRPGALATTGKSIKLKLPNGFKWAHTDSAVTVKNVWNSAEDGKYSVKTDDDRTLYIDASQVGASNSARYLTVDGLKVVADDADAKTGDVEVTVSGDSSVSTSTVVIGKYGNYTGAVSAAEAKEVYGGSTGAEVADITLKEDSPGTLIQDRTITLTLSGNAKWSLNSDGTPVGPRIKSADSKLYNFAFDGEWTFSGSDKKTIKRTVKTPSSSKAATIVLEKGEIDVAPNANGDIKVTVGGTAGISGEAVVAKAKAPVTVEVASKKDVVVGTQEQEIADIVIKEAASEAIDKKDLVLEFPEGVRPSLPADVEVEGDLKIDKSGITRDGRFLTIPVISTSSKPATIKVKGVKLVVDRTVPEGDVKVKITGPAVFDGYDVTIGGKTEFYRPFSASEYVAEGVVANVTTPGAGKGGVGTAVFKLNSKTFTVNGKEVEMDVQPLVKWDRAYVPVRFAANAFGIADENILWDEKTQTVTIFHNGKVVQMTVGKKEYSVNGVKVAMDVPVFRNKAETNNRTLLPIRYVANALGIPVEWNKETGEIILGEQK